MSLRQSTPLTTLVYFFISVLLLGASTLSHAKPSWKNNNTGDDSTEEPTKGGGKGNKGKNAQATITIHSAPLSQTVMEGNSVIFSVDASSSDGQTLNYQWFFNDNPISSANSNSYNITSSAINNAGSYKVAISNPDKTVNSSATLTVEALPSEEEPPAEEPTPVEMDIQISLHPVSQSTYISESLTLNVSASGSGTLNYQWRKDGVEIPNAIHSYYSISNASEDQGGIYDVVISNATGSLASNSATITINPLHTISLQWTHPNAREDGSTLELNEIASYKIYLNYENQSEEVIEVPASYTSLDIDQMYAGTYEFAIATVDTTGSTGQKSVYETLLIN